MNPRRLRLIAFVAGIGIAAALGIRSRLRRRGEKPAPSLGSQSARVVIVQPSTVEPKRAGWKRWLLRFGAAGVALGIAGFLLAASGVIPIKASSGHWTITEWVLQFSKSRSVATHTIGVKVPDLDDPALVLKGAGHYETGCAPCHGSPQRPRPRVAQYMLPPPPDLKHIRERRDDAELFYIVKHGIKFTGMPAWPAAHRDDEVWAVAAFLRELPRLDAQRYHDLAIGDAPRGQGAVIESLQPQNTPRAVIESCVRCHGTDGLGRGLGVFPKLAGQTAEYIHGSLEAYAGGKRHSGIMGPVAAGLSADAMRELAKYYAGLSPSRSVSAHRNTSDAITRGRTIALHGLPHRRVPPCIECHGPREGPRNPHYPMLAGQFADYLTLQLELFRKQHRGGTRYAHLMHFVAANLTTEQMRDVAAFFESLPARQLPNNSSR